MYQFSKSLSVGLRHSLAAVGLGATCLFAAGSAQAACEYEVTNSWGSGFTASINITNDTGSAVNGWQVSWQYSGGNRVSNGWNANIVGSNPYNASDSGWNGSLQPGQSTSFGFQGTANGSVEVPTVTGDVCGGGSSSSSSSTSTTGSSSTSSTSSTSSSTTGSTSTNSSSTGSSSTSSSGGECGVEMCKWYQDDPRPLCQNQDSGWGWENNQSCIGRSTCESQPAGAGGVVNSCGTSTSSSSSSTSSTTSGSSTSGSSSGSSSTSSSTSTSSTTTSSTTSSSGGSSESLYTLADFPIGVAVSAGNESRSFLSIPEKQVTIKQHFSQLTAGNIMKMSYLHPQENTYTFDQADAMVDWAVSNGLSVHGHTFIWHSDYQVPGWMNNYSGDFATMLNDHVTTIADHFEGRVVSWDVVNEVIDENQSSCYRNSVFYQRLGIDFVANAFTAARAADPSVELYYNDYDTEGGNATKLNCLLQLVDTLQDNNIPIDGVGFQMHVQVDWPSVNNIASAFQAIVDRGLKVKITELDVPINNPYASGAFPQHNSYTAQAAALQKARYKSIVQTYLDVVPAHLRGGVTVWGLWDGDSWLLDFDNRQGVDDWPLLFNGPANGPYQEKEAFYGVVEALTGQ